MNGSAEWRQLSGHSTDGAAPPTRGVVLEIVSAAAVLLSDNGQTTERLAAAAKVAAVVGKPTVDSIIDAVGLLRRHLGAGGML
jgi:hypothetical protein